MTLLLQPAQLAVVEHEDVKNEKGLVEFTVLHGNTVQVPNHHRGNGAPKLTFSLISTRIEKIDKLQTAPANSSVWALRLEDQSSLDVTVKEVVGTGTNEEATSEYSILWHGDHHRPSRELCLHYPKGTNGTAAAWYQGYVSNNSHWPMDPHFSIGRVQFNSMMELERYSVPTSAAHWTREFQFILEQLFLNSDGFAVHLDHRQPLFIRRDANGNAPEALICFSTAVDNHYYPKRLLNTTADLDLKLSIFSAKNTRVVTDHVVHRSGYIPKPTYIPADLLLIRSPTFTSDGIFDLSHVGLNIYSESTISKYIENITSKYSLSPKSQFLIERYNWLNYSHGYEIDAKTFPNMSSFADGLAAKGVSLGGMLAGPTLSVNDKAHPEYRNYTLHTAATNYPTWTLDFTKPETVAFYSALLARVARQYRVATFWLKSFIFWGDDCNFHDPAVTRYFSLFVPAYIEAASRSNVTVISEMAYRSQHLPAYTRLVEYYPTSAGQMLRELVPMMLSASISGYSFLLPFPAGTFNDYFKWYKTFRRPSEELYIRLLQATTFMAGQSFTRPPWNYTDNKAVELTKKFIGLHAEHAETIIDLMKRRVATGSPVLRPVWYNYPEEPKAYHIGDQFMLGENILVAPVTVEGQRERPVFIPPGSWVDQHGKTFKGPAEVKVLAPLEELPYFKKAEHFE